MADWVKQENLGLTVPPGDVDAMAQAIETMLLRPGGRAAYAACLQEAAGGFAMAECDATFSRISARPLLKRRMQACT